MVNLHQLVYAIAVLPLHVSRTDFFFFFFFNLRLCYGAGFNEKSDRLDRHTGQPSSQIVTSLREVTKLRVKFICHPTSRYSRDVMLSGDNITSRVYVTAMSRDIAHTRAARGHLIRHSLFASASLSDIKETRFVIVNFYRMRLTFCFIWFRRLTLLRHLMGSPERGVQTESSLEPTDKPRNEESFCSIFPNYPHGGLFEQLSGLRVWTNPRTNTAINTVYISPLIKKDITKERNQKEETDVSKTNAGHRFFPVRVQPVSVRSHCPFFGL